MGLGGPVWHASVQTKIAMPAARIHKLALKVLQGVGDPAAGEWMENRWSTVHVRRRLSESEAALVGPVLDVRCTPEAKARAARLGDLLQFVPDDVLREEVGA